LYRKALSADPNSLTAKVFYVGFLERRRRLDEAMQILDTLWQRVNMRPYLSHYVYIVLEKKEEFARCIKFLEEAIEVEPNNAYAWVNLGNCRNSLGDFDAAADAFGKAVALRPRRGPTRGAFAQNLTKAGRLDEAELQYRKLLELEPDNPVVHFWLAKFLAEHHPEHKAEALRQAKVALGLAPKGRLRKETIQRFIDEIDEETE
jgi:tetratricopeptide (TPR) repeat protein